MLFCCYSKNRKYTFCFMVAEDFMLLQFSTVFFVQTCKTVCECVRDGKRMCVSCQLPQSVSVHGFSILLVYKKKVRTLTACFFKIFLKECTHLHAYVLPPSPFLWFLYSILTVLTQPREDTSDHIYSLDGPFLASQSEVSAIFISQGFPSLHGGWLLAMLSYSELSEDIAVTWGARHVSETQPDV